MSQPASLVASSRGLVTVRGRDFPVAVPTPADEIAVRRALEKQCERQCVHPLVALKALPPDAVLTADRAEFIRVAAATLSGGGVRPTAETVTRQYGEVEGLRYRLLHAARKVDPSVTPADVEAAVDDETRDEVSAALDVALGYAQALPKA